MNAQQKIQELSRCLFQLIRSVRIIGRRLPRNSMNQEFIEEMMSLIRHMEYLERQLENPMVRQHDFIAFVFWKATREIDYWVLTLKEINPLANLESASVQRLTRRIRDALGMKEDHFCKRSDTRG